MRLFNSGSKGVGAAEIIIGGAAGVFFGKNAFNSYSNAADLLGNTGDIMNVSNIGTVALAELTSLLGKAAGNTITTIPESWWIGEGYNHLSAGNWSTLLMATSGYIAIKGFGDLFRGIEDMGGSSRGGM